MAAPPPAGKMTLYEKNPRLVRQSILISVGVSGPVQALLHLLRGKHDDAVIDLAVAVVASAVLLTGFELWLRWRRAGGAIALPILLGAWKARLRRRGAKGGKPLTPPR